MSLFINFVSRSFTRKINHRVCGMCAYIYTQVYINIYIFAPLKYVPSFRLDMESGKICFSFCNTRGQHLFTFVIADYHPNVMTGELQTRFVFLDNLNSQGVF